MKNMFREYNCLDEYDRFIQSFSEDPNRGIRMNALKIYSKAEERSILDQIKSESKDEFFPETFHDSHKDSSNERVPWSDDGYYITNDFFPGRHFFYLAGLFYVQEPSAMLPAHVLDAKPGEHILDLCAAPGGKTAKIAADMKGKGILFSNDINETRVKALVRNVELMGCTNCVVLNETPEHIAQKLPGYFDKILLDAPCSGEGMFRRDPDAMVSWEKFGNRACASMQKEILSCVDRLLRPGGILVYSTCTFSTLENEEMIQLFIEEFPGFEVLPIEKTQGIDSGLSHIDSIKNTVRIFPHHTRGEGHFCAKLQKKPVEETTEQGKTEKEKPGIQQDINILDNIKIKEEKIKKENKSSYRYGKMGKSPMTDRPYGKHPDREKEVRCFTENDFIDSFKAFSNDVLTTECVDSILQCCSTHFQMVQGHVYTLPEAIPSLDGLKIAKKGLYLGEMKRTKSNIIFEPSHSFLLSRNPSDLSKSISFSAKDLMMLKYIKGETLFFPQHDTIDPSSDKREETDLNLPRETANYRTGQFIPICVQGYPIGWGKGMQGDMIKNLYPQGWRR